LSGLRIDKHNYLNKIILSPRIALLYKYNNSSQFRFNYGAGFRAPQAFDSDLHIAFANGGVSRIQLSPNLTNENSTSFSTSYNFDQIKKNTIYGVTIDCFYTFLAHSFILENIGVDSIGEIFEKRNGSGALVKGVAIEGRINIAKKIQIETGFTLQQSKFKGVKWDVSFEPKKSKVSEMAQKASVYSALEPTFTVKSVAVAPDEEDAAGKTLIAIIYFLCLVIKK
jgi:outer membrane receptor for ferrienterochelin and colicins